MAALVLVHLVSPRHLLFWPHLSSCSAIGTVYLQTTLASKLTIWIYEYHKVDIAAYVYIFTHCEITMK